MSRTDAMRDMAEGRSDLFSFDPENLVIITDPKHPLYDERATIQPSEAFILNVLAYGVLEPVLIRTEQDGDKSILVVIAGRQRVRAAREANKRLVAKGELPIKVPAIRKKSEDATAMGIMVSENEIRRADEVFVKARKAQRLIEFQGYTTAQAGVAFGVSEATVRRWVELLDASAEVQAAVAQGLPVGAALKLAALPVDKQAEALTALKTDGKVDGKKAPRGASAEKAANDAVEKVAAKTGAPVRQVRERDHMRSIKQVRALIEYLGETPHAADKETYKVLMGALRWAMGDQPKNVEQTLEAMGMTMPEACKDKGEK